MSKSAKINRVTVKDLQKHKNETPLVCLTAYTAPMAEILDPFADLLLVGDSLGMVVYGMESTLAVTLDMMIAHGLAVMRGSKKSHVTIDMPFGTYQESKEQAYRNAVRIMQETGCSSVKLEGGQEMAETVCFLTHRGIPVVGHIGLLPQSFNSYGGYGARGKTKAEAKKIMKDAQAITDAGACALVIEGTVESLACAITEKVSIPTIGIGASVACDGQILVTDDMLGLFRDFTPKFVKQYGQIAEEIEKAVEAYADDVKNRKFPTLAQTF